MSDDDFEDNDLEDEALDDNDLDDNDLEENDAADDDEAYDDDDEADGGYDDEDPNRITAGTARSVLEYLARAVVDEPDDVEVEVEEGRRGGVQLSVRVAPDDMGRVIGRRGRVANAIRTVVRAAAVRDDVQVDVEFVDD